MQLREQMKMDLIQAMKTQERAAVATLRSVLAAIDNAEAVPVRESKVPIESVVGKSNEVPRKVLSADEIRQIVQRERDERQHASVTYGQLGQKAEAARLQKAAALIATYLTA